MTVKVKCGVYIPDNLDNVKVPTQGYFPAFIRPYYGNNFSLLLPPGEGLLTSVIFMIFIDMFQILHHLSCTDLISVLMSFCSSLIEAPIPRCLYHLLFPNQTSTMDPSIDRISKRELQTACPTLPPSNLKKPDWSSPPFPKAVKELS